VSLELLDTHDCAIIHCLMLSRKGDGDMGKRREPRMPARLQVRMAGTDASGRALLQMVATLNISRQGALLEGVQGTFKPGEIISVSYKNNKARFRVIWAGDSSTDKAGQIALQSIDPVKCIWDVASLPPIAADTYTAQAKERRQHQRVPCKLGAELYTQGSEALVRVTVTNISVGGCFVEMHTLPPDEGRVRIIVWANDAKLNLQGLIASRRPGFGLSIKFMEMTEEVRLQLQRFVHSQSVVRGG
jgi:hypothetical protein